MRKRLSGLDAVSHGLLPGSLSGPAHRHGDLGRGGELGRLARVLSVHLDGEERVELHGAAGGVGDVEAHDVARQLRHHVHVRLGPRDGERGVSRPAAGLDGDRRQRREELLAGLVLSPATTTAPGRRGCPALGLRAAARRNGKQPQHVGAQVGRHHVVARRVADGLVRLGFRLLRLGAGPLQLKVFPLHLGHFGWVGHVPYRYGLAAAEGEDASARSPRGDQG